MKFLALSLACLAPIALLAQRKITLSLTPQAGYEVNMLKSPDVLIGGDSTSQSRNDLWKNAPFVGLDASLSMHFGKRHSWKVKAAGQQALFTDRLNVRANSYDFGIGYTYKGKRIKNTISIGARQFVRTGSEDFDDILGVPLSYRRLTASDKITVKLNKPWSIAIRPDFEYKQYDQASFDAFYYWDPGMRLTGLYKYNYKSRMGIAPYVEYHQRNYRTLKLLESADTLAINEEEDEPMVEIDPETGEEIEIEPNSNLIEEVGARRWHYLKGGVNFRFPSLKAGTLVMGGHYTYRHDQLQGRLGYNQFGLSFAYEVKGKSTRLKLGLNSLYRMYTHFTATTETGNKELLRYLYVIPNVRFTQQLAPRIDLIVSADAKYKHSSINNQRARNFRSYFIASASVGLRFKLGYVKSKERGTVRK